MTPTTDDRALLMTLAKACGWTCTLNVVGDWLIANRTVTPHKFGAYRDEDQAWNDIYKAMGRPLHSVDAAMGLPWPEEHYLVMMAGRSSKGRKDNANVALVIADTEYKAEAATLASALCEVFAQWWGEKEAGK